MLSGPQSTLAWKISITVLHGIALASGCIRVFQRWRTKLMWWDDYAVLPPIVFNFIGILLFWLQFRNYDAIAWETADEDSNTFLFSWWFYFFTGFSTLWGSRISLSLSLARLFMPGSRYRKSALWFTAIISSLYISSLLVTTLGCRGSPWWKLEIEACINTESTKMFGKIIATLFVFEFISDLFLIAGPLTILWRIKFPPMERLLILSLFSSSVMTLMASMLYAVLYYATSWRRRSDSRLLFTVMGHIETCLSLLAANLLVVTMLLYKSLRKRKVVAQRPARPHVETDKSHKTAPIAQSDQNSSDSSDERTTTTKSTQASMILSLTVLSEFRLHDHPSSPMDAYGHFAVPSQSLSDASQGSQPSQNASAEEKGSCV